MKLVLYRGRVWGNKHANVWLCRGGVLRLFAIPDAVTILYVTAHRHPTRDRMCIEQGGLGFFLGDGERQGWGPSANEWLAKQELLYGQPFYIQIEYDL